MKQMTKEELIEYFIKLLGNNHVLERYISIEEIRKRLNENIEKVTYENEEGNVNGHYNHKTKLINISLKTNDVENQMIIVHELLHVLSFSLSENESDRISKVGFQIEKGNDVKGLSINEGITQLLTEEILGINVIGGYDFEKDFTRLMFGVFGKENVIDFYFSKATCYQDASLEWDNFFGLNSSISNHGNKKSQRFLEAYNSLEQLSTMMYNAKGVLREDQKRAYDQIRKNMYFSIDRWISEVLKDLNSNCSREGYNRKKSILEAIVQYKDIFRFGHDYREIYRRIFAINISN